MREEWPPVGMCGRHGVATGPFDERSRLKWHLWGPAAGALPPLSYTAFLIAGVGALLPDKWA